MIRKLGHNDYFLSLPQGRFKSKPYQNISEYSHLFTLLQEIPAYGRWKNPHGQNLWLTFLQIHTKKTNLKNQRSYHFYETNYTFWKSPRNSLSRTKQIHQAKKSR